LFCISTRDDPPRSFDAESSVIIEGRLPSKHDIPSSVVEGLGESERLAQLQRTISDWMEHRASASAVPQQDTDHLHEPRDSFNFLHRLTCSKQLSLRLAAELLGDNCASEEDANKRCIAPRLSVVFAEVSL
jgi:hypothetical protein